jgi:hypothetical protein
MEHLSDHRAYKAWQLIACRLSIVTPLWHGSVSSKYFNVERFDQLTPISADYASRESHLWWVAKLVGCRRFGGHNDSDEAFFERCVSRPWGLTGAELNINAKQRQNSLQDSCDADQYDEQLEQLRQSTIGGKLVYRPKTDGADNNDNQNTNQSRKHIAIPPLPW